MALLEVENLSVSFDGIHALQEVSLSVEPGQLFALVGPNGAGKTTLFNCLSRICRQDSGRISFRGQEISGLKPPQIPAIGLGRTFQNIELFAGLTTSRPAPGSWARCSLPAACARQRSRPGVLPKR